MYGVRHDPWCLVKTEEHTTTLHKITSNENGTKLKVKPMCELQVGRQFFVESIVGRFVCMRKMFREYYVQCLKSKRTVQLNWPYLEFGRHNIGVISFFNSCPL